MALRWTSSLFALLFLGLLATGCGDTSAHYAPFDDGGTPRQETPPPDPTANQTPQGPTYTLEAVGDTHFEAYAGTSVDISARLVSDDPTAPVENERITFEIISGTNHPDLRLEANSVFVDANGVAGNRLRAGESFGTIVVHATHEAVSTPLEFKVTISAYPVGTLRIFTNHDRQDVFPLNDIELRLWDYHTNPCSMVFEYGDFASPPQGEALLPTIDDTYTFEDLNVLDRYTVALRAYGPQGQISGFACLDNIELIPDDLTDVTIPLQLIELLATGTYDVTSYWDFSEALRESGAVGSAIMDIINWTADPGGMLADHLLKEFVGPFFCDDWNDYTNSQWITCYTFGWDCNPNVELDDSAMCIAFRYYEQDRNPARRIGDFINDQVSSIGILDNLMQIGQDLRDTVTHMKVKSVLTIDGKSYGEGEVTGEDKWVSMFFNWNGQERELGVGDGTEFGALQARWTGRIHDYNRLEIAPHEMEIPYGRVIMHFLTNNIIPAITGGNATTIGGALEHWVCDSLGGLDIAGFTVPADTMRAFCRTAVGVVDITAGIFVGNLTLPINLHISGEGTLLDYTSDGTVDVIEEGLFYGDLESGGTTHEMSAEFTAERQLNP